MFSRCEASPSFSSFLKSCREHSLFQSFLPPAKILSDKECGTIAVTYFYNDHQSKRMSCLDLFFSSGQLLLLQLRAAPEAALTQTIIWDQTKPYWTEYFHLKNWRCFEGKIAMLTFSKAQKHFFLAWFVALPQAVLRAATLSWSSSTWAACWDAQTTPVVIPV